MSWSILSIFVLLITWGFTKSVFLGSILLIISCILYSIRVLIKNNARKTIVKTECQKRSRQEFLASELKRLNDLRESGLLTEDEFTVQNRLLSCKRKNTYIQS